MRSPTTADELVPVAADPSLVDTLSKLEAAWKTRPLLRRLYTDWFELIAERLAPIDGPTIELGSGFAPLRQRLPDLITTDVEPTPWADEVIDAQAIAYPDSSLANIIAMDVLHHLAEPTRFLDEARRTLKPGGRVVAIEPYTSALWTVVYRSFHHELTEPKVNPFEMDPRLSARAMEGNQALPTSLFFRRADEFRKGWPELRIVEQRRFAFIVYPLSGGFTRRPLLPLSLYRPLRGLEALLSPAAPLIASRCLIVLERA
jgi:SAM-dependent methyltransferase